MHLREVLLRNWRSFRSARFLFPAPAAEKRVILVGAMNGTGKTSLLVGLYLGLFGREAMQFVQGVKLGANDEERLKSYRQLIEQILHRPALDQDDDPLASVQLLFEHGTKQVRIERTWYFSRNGRVHDLDGPDGEEVRLSLGGKPQRIANWQEANNRIAAELFPAHVMSSFFFDGEQAQARVEASGAAAMSEAVRVLFGTGLLEELDTSLKVFVSNERTALKRDVGELDEEGLDRKRRRRDEIEENLDGVRKDLAHVRKDLESANAARQEKNNELVQLAGDATVDATRIAQRKAEVEGEEADVRERLQNALSDIALPLALTKHGRAVVEQLRAELVRDRWTLLRDATQEKVANIVAEAIPAAGDVALSPPLTEQQQQALALRLQKTLQSLWHPPPEGCASAFRFSFLNQPERSAAVEKIAKALSSGAADIGTLVVDSENARARVRDIRRQWEAISDFRPKIEQIRSRITELDDRIRELMSRKAALENTERGLGTEHRELLGAIGQMESAKRKLRPAERKLDLAERVRSVISAVDHQLQPLCKDALADSCTKHFRGMISDEYRNYHVGFDADFQPILRRAVSASPDAADKNTIYVTTLSGAQKRAFGLSFSLALAEVTGEEVPIVIDTPVGNADSEYRKRMLTYLAKNSKGQVIFLSHDEEIYGPYEEALRPYTLKRCLVKFEPVGDGAGVSSVIDDRYFGSTGSSAAAGARNG